MKFRKFLLWLHWATGLLIALYAILMGLTGAALVFREEIKAWENPELHRDRAHGSWDASQTLAAAQRQFADWRTLSVNFPNDETPLWMAYLLKGSEAREAYFSPADGSLVALIDPKAGWSGRLADLHFNLWGGRRGRLVSGYGTLLLIFLCLSGLYLWLPPQTARNLGQQLRARLTVTPSAGWRRLSWQLHHTVGIVAWLFVMLLSVSGTYFVWSRPFLDFSTKYLVRSSEPKVPAHPATSELLAISALADKATTTISGLPILRIAVVTAPDQPVRVTLREGTRAEFHLVSTVFLDPVTGAVLGQQRSSSRPSGDAFLSWLSALHFGVFGGWAARLAWFVLALSLPVLAASGFWMWYSTRTGR